MKRDITEENKTKLCLIILLIFNEHCFYILNSFPYWLPITLVYSLVFWTLYRDYRDVISRNIVISFVSLGAISCLYTIVDKLQSPSKAVASYLYFIIPCVGIPIADNKIISKKSIKEAIMDISVMVSTLYLIQSLIGHRIQFIHNIQLDSNGTIRIIHGSILISIGFIFLLTEYLNDLSNMKLIIRTLIVGLTIIAVIQSRSIIFSVAVTAFFIVARTLGENIRENSKTLWLTLLLIVSCLVCITGYRLVSEIVKTSIGINESSSVLRIGGYRYYIELFTKHPIFGIGKIRNQAVDGFAQWGISRKYYIDDIGIVGYVAQLGILGICFFVYWIRTTLIILKNYNNGIAEQGIMLFIVSIMPFNMILNIDTLVLYMVLLPVMYFKE